MIYLMDNARQNYYTEFIEENSYDQGKLFKASKSLLNLQADKTLPPYDDASTLANEMGEYFVQKVTTIRDKLDNYCPPNSPSHAPKTSDCYNGTVLSQFDCLSEKNIWDMIVTSNKKCCPLDPIPASILSTYVDILLPAITKMVNLSLQSGKFPENWKNALVRPLLKKSGLDQTVFKNFRPISNLQFVSKLTEGSS